MHFVAVGKLAEWSHVARRFIHPYVYLIIFITEQILMIYSVDVRVYEYIRGGNFILSPTGRNNAHSTWSCKADYKRGLP